MMPEMSKSEKPPKKEVGKKESIKEELKREFEETPKRIREYLEKEGWGGISKETKGLKGEDLEATIRRRERKAFEINVHQKGVKEIVKTHPEMADSLIKNLENRIEEVAGTKREKVTEPDWELAKFLMEKFKQEFPEKEKTKEVEK